MEDTVPISAIFRALLVEVSTKQETMKLMSGGMTPHFLNLHYTYDCN